MKALLIGNGQMFPKSHLKELSRQADFILAADGGADAALQAGVIPHAVIGDLDSVSAKARRTLPAASFIHCRGQNDTDLEKALRYLVKQKCSQCTLVGFIGKRWDFSIGNLLMLARFARKLALRVELENGYFQMITKPRTFEVSPQKRMSLIPLKACRGVTVRGAKYPLKNASLPVGTTRSLSNLTTAKRVCVSLKSGCLAVYLEN